MQLTNEALAEVARLVPLGLRALFPTLESDSPTPILTLLPPSPSTSLPLLLLALASEPRHPLLILDHPRHLQAALAGRGHPAPSVLVLHASVFERGVALDALDLGSAAGVLIVGDPERKFSAVAASALKGASVKWWEEIWEAGEAVEPKEARENLWSDTFGWFYAPDGEVLTATHMVSPANQAASSLA